MRNSVICTSGANLLMTHEAYRSLAQTRYATEVLLKEGRAHSPCVLTFWTTAADHFEASDPRSWGG